MARRVAHWIGWTLAFSLMPLLGIAVVAYLRPAPGRSVAAVLATGDVALTAVAWLASAVAELRDTRPRWESWRAALTGFAVFGIALNAFGFGAIYTDRTRGDVGPGGVDASRATVQVAVWDLIISGVASTFAVAVGTPEERGSR